MRRLLKAAAIAAAMVILLFFTRLLDVKLYQDELDVLPSLDRAPLEEVLEGYGSGSMVVRLEDEVLDLAHAPMFSDGGLYLPAGFVQAYFNEDFFWDEEEKVLTYTTLRDVIRMQTEDLTYFVNDAPLSLEMPILELKEQVPYMPMDLVVRFSNAAFEYKEELDLLLVEDLTRESLYASIGDAGEGGVYARVWKDRTSPYVERLESGDRVQVYEDDGLWLHVKTASGLTGYIKKKYTVGMETEPGLKDKLETEPYAVAKQLEGKVNMAWHQVFNVAANARMPQMIAKAEGLNVLSPTWFSIKNEEGDLSNIADMAYVRQAHARGIQVWALVDNQFNKALTHEVLSSTAKREHVIKQLLAYAAIYDLDGINIDFENVGQEDGVYFVQFMKELTPYLKSQGLVVSVDMYVPSAWTAHYDRTAMGELVDYVMIMGYDEHWSTSPVSGSVASISFVERGIAATLEEVPPEKTVLGVPFYTRKWKEVQENGEVVVSAQSMSMNGALNDLEEKGVESVWLEEIGQYYGEYMEDGSRYRIWLEEERSMEEKVKLMDAYGLAGAAAWKLGLERDEIWPLLNSYLK